MNILRKLEKVLDERLRGIFASPQEGSKEAIELYREALTQTASRAKVSAFNRVRIELRADSPERRAVLEALFEPVQMLEDIRAALLEEGVAASRDLSVAVEYPAEAAAELRVFCEKSSAVRAPSGPAPSLRIGDVELKAPVVNVGRISDVLDSTGRPIRRNHLCFTDEPTVSRSHAHIKYNPADGEWRIFDDGSSTGTAVFRDGVRIDVPAHASRGVGLRAGDEIYFGSKRVRLELNS